MLNPMEFNEVNNFQQSVTHTHSEKIIYLNPHLAYPKHIIHGKQTHKTVN
jgi:hypothetical protein